jgi:hypothetical protein
VENSIGRLRRLLTRAGQPITGHIDGLRCDQFGVADGVWYGHDLAGRLTGVVDNGAAIVAAVPPSGSSVQYATTAGYDALNRPTGISWTPATAVAASTASSVTFGHTYNKANQRIGQTATENSWFNYPAATPGTVSYTADALNRYTAVGAVSPTYDGNSRRHLHLRLRRREPSDLGQNYGTVHLVAPFEKRE